VIRDPEKISFEYVPQELPGREEELSKLSRGFRSVLGRVGAANAVITGPVGTGKTALSKYFCRTLREEAKKGGVNVEWTDVNCRQRSTDNAALLKILQTLDPHFPDRGFSLSEMLDVLRKQLERREAQLLVILDEADILLKRSGSDLLYALTRFNEEGGSTKVGVSVLLVGLRDPRQFLDEAARSTFKPHVLELKPYDVPAMAKIVHQRVDLAFQPGSFPEELVELAAEMAAPAAGNARTAIELLEKAGQVADGEGKRVVEAEHLRAAKAEIQPFVDRGKLSELDRHKRLTLLALTRVLRKGGAYAITGEIERVYAVLCEEAGEKPRAHTQFWTYLKDLEALGLIQAKRSGKGVLGMTTLVSLPDVPAAVLETELVALEKRG
jgi:cell division control protein 6